MATRAHHIGGERMPKINLQVWKKQKVEKKLVPPNNGGRGNTNWAKGASRWIWTFGLVLGAPKRYFPCLKKIKSIKKVGPALKLPWGRRGEGRQGRGDSRWIWTFGLVLGAAKKNFQTWKKTKSIKKVSPALMREGGGEPTQKGGLKINLDIWLVAGGSQKVISMGKKWKKYKENWSRPGPALAGGRGEPKVQRGSLYDFGPLIWFGLVLNSWNNA